LAGREHEVVRGFSAGMRKRLAFAKVLLQDAPLVLLDEPYGQLDPAGFGFVDRLVEELLGQDRAVVMVTHIIDRAAGLLQSGVVLDGGRMAWVGDARDLPVAFEEAA
jgi:heme exporter protein A